MAQKLFSSVIGKLTRLSEDQKAGSQDDLADCYYNGYGVERDIKRATELYEMAAKGKDAHAMMMLRDIYRFGANGCPDLDMSSRWAEAYLAEKTKEGGDATRGLPDSCFAVGNIYRRGYGVVPDSASAFAWFEKAADKKSWKAMLRLADLLKNGEGCKKNVEAAREWEAKAIAELQPLADNGQAESQRGLADCYVNAWGVEKSYEMAVRLYADAYECRDWLALGRLSRLYAEGLGVAKDIEKARTMLQLAAEKESSEACGRLGECYEYGELSIAKDHKKAVEWYRKSAAEGDACGLFNLGRCYMNGIGVELDRKAAVMWLTLAAAEKGDFYSYNKKAEELLKEIQNA
jgi:TPR repeat protein